MTIGASASSQKSSSNNKIDPKSLELFNQTYQPGVAALGQVNTGAYGGPLGAGLDAQQLQAAGMAQNNVGVGQSQLASATGLAQGVAGYRPDNVQAGQLAGMDYSQYMNPYLDSVMGSTMSAIDRARQMSLVGNSQAAGPGAWGGSRHGVADSLTNEAAMREASSAANNIYSQGFGQAQQAGQFDINANMQGQLANQQAGMANAGLGLQAANSLAGFGQQANAMGAADANLINSFGQQAQATQQNANQMALDEWMRQQQQPYQLAAAYGGLANTVPITVDNKSKGSSMGVSGSYTYSDYRLKEDFAHVVTDRNGIDWFDYTMKATGKRERGVIAQQVAAIKPEAVRIARDGYLQVNYEALA